MIITVTLNPCVHHVVAFESRPGDQVVIKPVRSFFQPGGKGLNAARVIAGMGKEVTALTTLGDLEGRLLLRETEYDGVNVKYIEISRPTRISTCLYDMTAQSFRELLEPGVDMSNSEIDAFYSLFLETIEEGAVVSLNGSSPCKATDDFFQRAAIAAKDAGCHVYVDTYGDSLKNAVESAPHFVKMNRDEIRLSFGLEIEEEKELFAFASELLNKGTDQVLITDGSKGAWLYTRDSAYRIRVPQVRGLHAIGSGDAMLGAILVRLIEGDSVEEACRWGAAAGAVNAGRLEICQFSQQRMEDLLPSVELKRLDAPAS